MVFRRLAQIPFSGLALDNLDLLLGQPIQVIDQPVYLPVGGFKLPLEGSSFVIKPLLSKLKVQGKYPVNQNHEPIMQCLPALFCKVDCRKWQSSGLFQNYLREVIPSAHAMNG